MKTPTRALSEREQRSIAFHRRWQWRVLALGAALFLAGGLYAIWAVERLGHTPAGQEATAFDAAVVRFGGIAAEPRTYVERDEPSTPFEKLLLARVRMHADHAARTTIFSLRFMLASVLVSAGLVLVTAALARRPLLAIIARPSRP